MERCVGIICEYNPFHTGHAYHIAEARRQSGADFVIGMMSGHFVQRGEPAILPPAIRAEAAVRGGMDAVLMLPTVYACACGNLFAEGAVRLLAELPPLQYLAMGTEDDGDLLARIAETQYAPPDIYDETFRQGMRAGLSYGSAVTQATVAALRGEIAETQCEEILHKPNNLLAIEYLKAIRKFRPDIRPIFVPRIGNAHDDLSAEGDTLSASAIRKLLAEGDGTATKYLPPPFTAQTVSAYRAYPPRQDIYEALALQALRTAELRDIADVSEGIDKRLLACARDFATLEKALDACKNKRYPMSRLRRICVQALLGITKSVAAHAENACAKLLAARQSVLPRLTNMRHLATRNTDYRTRGGERFAEIDARAASVHALICRRDGNDFWDEKVIVIDN